MATKIHDEPLDEHGRSGAFDRAALADILATTRAALSRVSIVGEPEKEGEFTPYFDRIQYVANGRLDAAGVTPTAYDDLDAPPPACQGCPPSP